MTDIGAKSNSSPDLNNSVWSKSDNSFKFDFIPGDCPAPVQNPTYTASDETQPARGWFSKKGQGSNFLFNFKIPPVEQMETRETQDNQEGVQEQMSQDFTSIGQVVLQTKSKKKKKKSGKKTTLESQLESGSAQVNDAGKDTELVSARCFAPKID